jgi:hypothetical protein
MKHTINFSRFILIVLLAAGFTNAAFAQYSPENLKKSLLELESGKEIDVAVQMVKLDLVDYFPAEITASLKASYPALPEDRTIRVLPYVRENLITSGEDFNRAKAVADKLLRFMSLQNRVRFIFFNSEVPVTAFTYPFALTVSNTAAELLTDDELEAVMAHEIMHLIAYPIFKEAVESNNLKQQRIVELFCDGGSMAVMQTKGKDPELLISGLEKMQKRLELVNNDKEDGIKHPTLKQRRQFQKKLTEKFTAALSKAIKVQ